MTLENDSKKCSALDLWWEVRTAGAPIPIINMRLDYEKMTENALKLMETQEHKESFMDRLFDLLEEHPFKTFCFCFLIGAPTIIGPTLIGWILGFNIAKFIHKFFFKGG